jgi:VanZ family protein
LGILLDIAPIQVSEEIDKICHFAGFAIITALAIATFIVLFGRKSINNFLLFLLTFGGIFAGFTEILQKFIAVRSCCVEDWIVNLCGIAVVSIFAFLFHSKQEKEIRLNEERLDFKDLPIIFL